MLDAGGSAITSFSRDIAVSVQIDPTTVDLDRVQVLRWDDDTTGWTKVPTTTQNDGTVTFTTNHLSLYAFFELPVETRMLNGGLSYITFSGADGTPVEQFAAQFGAQLQSMFRFNAETQALETYIPGAPAATQTLTQLQSRDAVIVRLAEGAQAAVSAHRSRPTGKRPPPAAVARRPERRHGDHAAGDGPLRDVLRAG